MNSSVIDLSKLPAPQFVQPLDYESIVGGMLSDFRARHPSYTNVLESDPAYKLLEVAAYRELLLRHHMNEEGRALLVAFATGSDLDHLGMTYYDGEQRLVIKEEDTSVQPATPRIMEDDESYRRRLLLKDDSYSTAGASNAYKFHALSADGTIKDASVTSPEPGTTVVTILSREDDGTVTEEILQKVRAKLNSDAVRPLSEKVVVQGAQIIRWQLDADLYTYSGPDQDIVLKAAQNSFATYLQSQQLLAADITDSALSRALHVPGVFKVVRVMPIVDVVCAAHQAAWCTDVNIRLAGTK